MHRRLLTGLTVGAAAVALLGGGAWAVGRTAGPDLVAAAASSAPVLVSGTTPAPSLAPSTIPPVAPTPIPTPVATPTVAAAVTPARTCSIAGPAGDPRLLAFQGQVRDARTGAVLFSRRGGTASRAASVMKVLTSAAALHVLGPGYRFTTSVVAGSKPGQVVLVGGGDVTLTRTSGGTVYSGAPRLSTLAARVRASWAKLHPGVPITQVVLDASYFGGPTWQPSWDVEERIEGTTPKMTALMVDGDRDDPYERQSHRSTDPVGRAGAAFAAMLGSHVTTTRGVAPASAALLGSVRSQPVSVLVGQALLFSDNTIAEALARVTAIRSGAGDTYAAEQAGTVGALKAYGVSTAKLRVVDGSGLSNDDRIPPEYLTQLFRLIQTRSDGLGPIFDGLPVAGRTGSLSYSDRFQGAAARADGQVFAKTGWIDTGYTLAGIIHAKDGTPLTFAFYALGSITEGTKYALDALTADTWACGSRLSSR